jgi:hypothetical protein
VKGSSNRPAEDSGPFLDFDFPGSAHWLFDVGVGIFVVDEALFFGIEVQGAAGFHCDFGAVD